MTIADSVAPTIATPSTAATVVHEPAWDIARLFPNQGQWCELDFLELKTNRLVELNNGNVEVLDMPTEAHQDIVIFLLQTLLSYLATTKSGKAIIAPLHVKMANGRFRDPDVLFMLAQNSHRRHNDFWEGADLVMEVVSDNDRRRDLETKRFEYARAGIPEYWIVDPMLSQITVLTLNGDRYDEAGVYTAASQAASMLLPGFVVDVAATFAAK